ncbi:tetratricopeptide repeat protein [Christiangramia aquimixticola]|uniref:tetratricopeptide repeat protein n=1 Tax=Christiangramia aquimixticola TaxID=1697558 RepID=UPI003AA7E0C8
MKKLVTIYILLFSVLGFSQSEELFSMANQAYQKAEYEKAIDLYEEILANGESSSELYFNLGNAYYKMNQVAPSIYNYEKALQLDPEDEDILNNIEFARNMAIDDIEEIERTGISQWFNDLISGHSASGWAVYAVVFSVLFVIFFLLYYFAGAPLRKRIFLGLAAVSLLICIATIIFAFQRKAYISNNKFAIIFEEEIEVRDEPNLRGEPGFNLHEGTKAKVLEDFQEWTRIELANGGQGWVKTSELKKL